MSTAYFDRTRLNIQAFVRSRKRVPIIELLLHWSSDAVQDAVAAKLIRPVFAADGDISYEVVEWSN
jgi:hypothetical protein